jgi:hypothetical protein
LIGGGACSPRARVWPPRPVRLHAVNLVAVDCELTVTAAAGERFAGTSAQCAQKEAARATSIRLELSLLSNEDSGEKGRSGRVFPLGSSVQK